MDYSFYVIDDDIACRRILTQIIEGEALGDVVGELSDGRGDVVAEIIHKLPDIVLIDLLMPGKDGIEISEKLRERRFRGKIVMISQVENKEMVAQAYAAGIEFYINKPVNRIEVISVLKKVIGIVEMERSFDRVRSSIAALDTLSGASAPYEKNEISGEQIRAKTMDVLADLGIIGEPGAHDLVEIILFLSFVPDTEKYLGEYRHLKGLYQIVQQKYLKGDLKESSEVKAIEQRVRRAVKHAMENVAALGLDDYGNSHFERYSAKFFDFNDLRQKMRDLKEGKKSSRVRVSIKQFINALYMEVHN